MYIKTSGGCMRPLIKSGQVVYIKKTKKIKLGDIVLYRLGDKNYLHRVINIDKDEYTVYDDTNITSPVKIYLENIIGSYPTVFSGYIGFLYHKIILKIFFVCRKIIKFHIN